MSTLQGKRIALVEGRMSGVLADLVRRHGGDPYAVPALREATRSCGPEVAGLCRWLACRPVRCGGLHDRRWGKCAMRRGRAAATFAGMPRGAAGRHPRLSWSQAGAALRRRGLSAQVQARTPFTTAELLEAMADLELAGHGVALVHYGERHEPLAVAMRERGAQLDELCLYEWQLPEDVGPLQQLVRDLVAHRADAVAFTSKSQVRHLFQVATHLALAEPLQQAMHRLLVVAAVGPTTATELAAFGVAPHVMPENPKMGPMVMALAAYITAKTS